MKPLALLALVAGAYLYFSHKTPIAEVSKAATGQELAPLTSGPREIAAPQSNAIKRPIDRTRQVLGQVAEGNGAGQFQTEQ